MNERIGFAHHLFPAVHVGSTELAKNFSCKSGVLFFISVVGNCSFKTSLKDGDIRIIWRVAKAEEKGGAHPTLCQGEAVIRERKVFKFMTDANVAEILDLSVKGFIVRKRLRLINDDLERIMGAFMLLVKREGLLFKIKKFLTPVKQSS